MKFRSFTFVVLALLFISVTFVAAQEQELPDPKLTEVWEPVPPIVTPGEGTAAPSDAIVLFDGTDFSNWKHADGKPVKWFLNKDQGCMTVVKKTGTIETKQEFGDIQLHIEWRTPAIPVGRGQGRGNSGVFFQKRYELQVLDSYLNQTYSNGQAGSIYKQSIPLVNASKGPGEWQTYDAIFIAPRFNDDGSLKSPGYITVLHNGVLIQNHFEIQGPTEYRGKPEYKAHPLKQGIMLQDHGNPTSFRNIWVRELD